MRRRCETTLAMPSGGRGRRFTPRRAAAGPSSHPEQLFFIELASCCLFGRYHESTISSLPKFCRIPLTDKLPASRNPNCYFACLPTCSACEHCLGSDTRIMNFTRRQASYTMSWCELVFTPIILRDINYSRCQYPDITYLMGRKEMFLHSRLCDNGVLIYVISTFWTKNPTSGHGASQGNENHNDD